MNPVSSTRLLPPGPASPSAAIPAAVALLSAILLPRFSLGADEFTLHTAIDDTEQYFTAPLRWGLEDWACAGVAAAAVAAAHQYDGRVRAHFIGSRAVLGDKDPNSVRDALPTVAMVGGTWVYAELIGDRDGYRETWSMVEAGAFSTVTTEVLKVAAGRDRPDVTTSPDHWRQGGDSFPSVHATAAFAIGSVLAESGNDEYRWIRRIIGYGVAGATAYIRIRDNQHWLSDTVAGAAVGIATARFVLNRQPASAENSWRLQPIKGGWALSYVVDLK